MDNINITEHETKKIKRRNFFLYAGAGLAGIFSLSKLPMKILSSKVLPKKEPLKITANPYAVSRNTERKNG